MFPSPHVVQGVIASELVIESGATREVWTKLASECESRGIDQEVCHHIST